jgi:transketolase
MVHIRTPQRLDPVSVPDHTTSARVSHAELAGAVRALAMDGVEGAKSGHPGLPMGAADVATVLFTRFLKFDAADPLWPDRDRFVLSAGHGSMLLYALLHLIGVEGMTTGELRRFRQLDSKTPGHPEQFMTPGVEMTTGPLGQGLATAVGMALAERMLAAEYGEGVSDHRTYVLASDGDLMEGISHEAIALAGHLRLSRLIVLFDDNGISIDGPLSLSDTVDQPKRFEAAGWRAERVDGHDPDAIAAAIERAREADRPSLIAMPDNDRLRRAQEGGNLEGPWRAARRGRTCRGQGGDRLEPSAFRGAPTPSARPGPRRGGAA